ncbi:MAG TPA: transglycosylase SLT domain-containing protein [Kofleriaceae bacterium]|nr:transglycosylase SLT domain-containing protein [Kofleriaceae bacterium]
MRAPSHFPSHAERERDEPVHENPSGPARAGDGRGEARARRLVAEHRGDPIEMAVAIARENAMGDTAMWAALQRLIGNAAVLDLRHRAETATTALPLRDVMDDVAEDNARAIEEASRRYDVPVAHIQAIITQESRGDHDANAGATQRDRGRNAASGLMQVTAETWRNTQRNHPELARYPFATHRYDRRINILVGTATLADKRRALENMGITVGRNEDAARLMSMAYNAGEGLVQAAYEHAVEAGSNNPAADCLKAEHLMPAIREFPSVYAYYLTGGGKRRNPPRTVERAVELKFQEISRYPIQIAMLLDDDHIATESDDSPRRGGPQLA